MAENIIKDSILAVSLYDVVQTLHAYTAYTDIAFPEKIDAAYCNMQAAFIETILDLMKDVEFDEEKFCRNLTVKGTADRWKIGMPPKSGGYPNKTTTKNSAT